MMRKRLMTAIALAALGLWGSFQAVCAADNPVVGDGCCAGGCCHNVCRPTVGTKKVDTRCYGDVCEDFCLPRCPSCLAWLHGHKCGCSDCGDCAAGLKCEHLHTHKYLLVKIHHHEEPVNQCVLEPPCAPAPAPCLLPGPAEPLPAPKGVKQILYLPVQRLLNK
jgi:hypothetical protein